MNTVVIYFAYPPPKKKKKKKLLMAVQIIKNIFFESGNVYFTEIKTIICLM